MRLFGKSKINEQNDKKNGFVDENTSKTSYSPNEEDASINVSAYYQNRVLPTGDRNKDLMILIGDAIDKWVEMYHLQGMPRKAILNQVIGLMDAWNRDM